MVARRITLLGPQRLSPTLDQAVEALGVRGRVAAVTAGWEEREAEDLELDEHLGGRVVNLEVYKRADDVFQHDPELFAAMRERHDRMRQLQELYRLRLAAELETARALLCMDGDPELLEPERESAIAAVRALDEHHLERVRAVFAEFDERWRPREREHVVRHRREIAAILEETECLCIAGGHVAILLNRTRLFDVLGLAGDQPVIGWSAGAMVLAERIVLFHDSPPQGAGNAEVLGAGLGLCPGVVPLPHASRRLRLDDATRVGLFARRFGPDLCGALDERTRLSWDGKRWTGDPGTRRLSPEGTLVEVGGA